MPFTLFHYPFGYYISRANKNLNLPALLVGAVIPDIEVPFLFLFFSGVFDDHFILHSLVGALSIGLVLALVVTRFLYPPIIGSVFKLDKKVLYEKCKLTPMLVISVVIGILSHLAVDILHHWYNPILWPWIDPHAVVGPLCILFANLLGTDILGGYFAANTMVHIIIGTVMIVLVYRTKENRWYRLWVGN